MTVYKGFEEIVREKAPLGPLTTFKIGGPAEYFLQPRTEEELAAVLVRCGEEKLDVHVLGGGSNVLIPDAGVPGAVIQLDPKGFGKFEVVEGELVRVGASLGLPRLVRSAAEAHLSGVEPLVGIPGWVGGAVRMNAGGAWGDIGQVVERVQVMDTRGQVFWRDRDDLAFGYRRSNVAARFVLAVELRLAEDDENRIAKFMKEIWFAKKNAQPMSNRSAGCVFKNPRGMSAGALIDQCGLKGTKIGGAVVSRKHANYIVATAETSAEDVKKLIELILDKVNEKFETVLELELEIW
jgi:UDP-N-acetylmuramate dehydrogenase